MNPSEILVIYGWIRIKAEAYSQSYSQRDRRIDRQTCRRADRQVDWQTYRHADNQADKQTDTD